MTSNPNSHSSNPDNRQDPLEGLNILIVDDSEINQFLIKKSLEQSGIGSDFADNGLTAVEKIKEKKWDLVLMDLFMPEVDGFEATRIVRKLNGEYFKNLPIIALTSHPFGEIQDEIFAAGMTDYLTKPLDSKILLDMIRSYSRATSLKKPQQGDGGPIRFQKAYHHSMNDHSFYRQLLEMIRENLVEIETLLSQTISEIPIEMIRDLQHKVRPTLILLEKDDIDEHMTKAREMLATNEDSAELEDLVVEIKGNCQATIAEIDLELKEIREK